MITALVSATREEEQSKANIAARSAISQKLLIMKWRLAPLRHTQIQQPQAAVSAGSLLHIQPAPDCQHFCPVRPLVAECKRSMHMHKILLHSPAPGSLLPKRPPLPAQPRIVHTLGSFSAGRQADSLRVNVPRVRMMGIGAARERREPASERDRRHFHSSDNARIKIITTTQPRDVAY